jgi:hypothetical protein
MNPAQAFHPAIGNRVKMITLRHIRQPFTARPEAVEGNAHAVHDGEVELRKVAVGALRVVDDSAGGDGSTTAAGEDDGKGCNRSPAIARSRETTGFSGDFRLLVLQHTGRNPLSDSAPTTKDLNVGIFCIVRLRERGIFPVFLPRPDEIVVATPPIACPDCVRKSGYTLIKGFTEPAISRGAKPIVWMGRGGAENVKRYIPLAESLKFELAPVTFARYLAGIYRHQGTPMFQIPERTSMADPGGHPNGPNCYVFACTLYGVITGKSPEGLKSPMDPEGRAIFAADGQDALTEEQALRFQRAARQALEEYGKLKQASRSEKSK